MMIKKDHRFINGTMFLIQYLCLFCVYLFKETHRYKLVYTSQIQMRTHMFHRSYSNNLYMILHNSDF